MNKIRKGDDVIVTAGRDKGKRGTVLRRVDDDHLVVEGVNRVKKHQRPNPMKAMVIIPRPFALTRFTGLVETALSVSVMEFV